MAFKILPNLDYVVVKIQTEKVRPSGIIIPDMVQKSLRGTVVAIGAGRRSEFSGEFMTPFPKVGDDVFIARASGQEVMADDEAYVIVKNSDVLCILEPVPQEEPLKSSTVGKEPVNKKPVPKK